MSETPLFAAQETEPVPGRPKDERKVIAPFTVVIDTREQNPYSFVGLRANKDQGGGIVEVPTMRFGLPVGDYAILGLPQCVIERKSLADLYSSVVRRQNFEDRLERMSERTYSAVVVEASRLECVRNPPKFSQLHPKSLSRTLVAWDIRFPVKWHFIEGREAAEVLVYRILEKFWQEHREEGK